MVKRKWTLDGLRFTDKGFNVLYKAGHVVDKLIVMEYIGKHHVPSRNTWCPVYRCLCECGAQEYRTQAYLSSGKKNGRARHKWCDSCARDAADKAPKKMNALLYANVEDATPGYDPGLVDGIIKKIWTHADGLGGPVYTE